MVIVNEISRSNPETRGFPGSAGSILAEKRWARRVGSLKGSCFGEFIITTVAYDDEEEEEEEEEAVCKVMGRCLVTTGFRGKSSEVL